MTNVGVRIPDMYNQKTEKPGRYAQVSSFKD